MEEVKIGDQIWMNQNLDCETFNNGDWIPYIEYDEDWEEAGENGHPGWCYYKYESSNNYKYGKLYNWHAVNDPRGLASEGWRIPTEEDWIILTDYLGGDDVAGTKIKSSNGWAGEGNGINESGFSAVPGGFRDSFGKFEDEFNDGENCIFWTSTANDEVDALSRGLFYNSNKVFRGNYDSKGNGFSVRCIKEE